MIETTVARSKNRRLSKIAMNGGVAKTLLLHLFDMGRIDGAIVTKIVEPFICRPWLAVTRKEIIEAGAFHFDASHGVSLFGEKYSAYPPFLELVNPMAREGLRRIAFVGRPCQIETMRRMETLGIVPTDTIKYYLGLFCMGNFRFGEREQIEMEKIGGFKWEDVKKVNFKERIQVHLKSKEIKAIEYDKADFMKRVACHHCGDYSAEFADISFGHLGVPEGWTTVIIRTPVGRAIFADAADEKLEIFGGTKNREVATEALSSVRARSDKKKKIARENRKKLGETVSAGQ